MSDHFENLLLRLGFLERMEDFANFGIDEETIWYLSERQMEKLFDGNIGSSIKLKLALERERPLECVDPAINRMAKELSRSLSTSIVKTIENSIKKANIESRPDNFCMDFMSSDDSDKQLKQTVSASNFSIINKDVRK